jgi:cytochrome b561
MIRPAKPRAYPSQRDRYSTVAIAFHWLIAAAIAAQIFLGWRMQDLEGFSRSALLQIHKSVGISILLLTAARLVWRLLNPPPPHGSNLTALERRLSHWAHIGFYGLLMALPLTGWALVSAGRPGGMKLFGAIPWPSFPLLSLLPGKAQDLLADIFDSTHTALAWVMLALLALHVAGALKHQFISKDPTISRMAPGVVPGAVLDARLAAIPAMLVVIAALVYLPKPNEPAPRPKVTQLARADIYLDIVGPALGRRCASCHSDDEARGGLSLVNDEALAQGGINGHVVVPGDPAKSELYRRVTLPRTNVNYMPKDGKTPLNASQIAALKVWIQIGAPKGGTVGALKLSDDQKAVLQNALSAANGAQQADSGAGASAAAGAALPVVAAADSGAVHHLEDLGFVVRPISKSSQLVVVDFTSHRAVGEADFAALAKIAPQIRILNLRDGQVSDAQLKNLASLTNLSQLRLDDNPITDAGLASLSSLKALTYLNLVGSKVTDAGLAQLAGLSRLQRIYLWGAAVTPQGIDKLKAAHPGAFVYAGLKPADVPREPKMAPIN